MKIVVYNLGCKVNQYECDSLVGELRRRGYEVVEELEYADVYILNTCAVTNEAERKSRQCVGRCLHFNPNGKVIVCGCASQNDAKQFANKQGVTYVSGVANKALLVDKLEEKGVLVDTLPTKYENNFHTIVERTRAYVKIQDGCNNFCSYCLIPYLRGRNRSRDVDSVVDECKSLENKCKEIVLTGIDISSYGKDIGSSLVELLDRLGSLSCRIRLGSLEVGVITRELLEVCNRLYAFCPQFHLSLQSGSNGVLKRMNRKYTNFEYMAKVQLIREFYPLANITTDIICAFPTESAEQAIESKQFVANVGFGQIHVFVYSPRKGTVASKLPYVNGEIAKARRDEMIEIAKQSKQRYLEKFLGREVEILVEEKQEKMMAGYSREYIRCLVQGAKEGSLVLAVGKEIKNGELVCQIVKE